MAKRDNKRGGPIRRAVKKATAPRPAKEGRDDRRARPPKEGEGGKYG